MLSKVQDVAYTNGVYQAVPKMPIDMGKNVPPLTIRVFKGTTVDHTADTYESQTVNGQLVAPYIYSYSTTIDPRPRALHNLIEHNSSLYSFGGSTINMARRQGLNPPSPYSNELWRYNLITTMWTSVITTDTPVARAGAAFFKHTYAVAPGNGLSAKTYAFLLFGYGDAGCIDGFHSYDFSTANWAVHATVGDTSNTTQTPSTVTLSGILNDTMSIKPVARQLFGHVLYNGKLYIIGGLTESLTEVDDIWRLDLNTFQWTLLLVDSVLARHSMGVALVNDSIFIMSGQGISSIYSYSITTGILTEIDRGNKLASNPVFGMNHVKLHTCFVLGTDLFFIGGYSAGYVNQGKVRLYQMLSGKWSILTENAIPYTKPDMDSIAGFGFYTTGLPISGTSEYELYIDDGFSSDTGANYHSGLWRITISRTGSSYTYLGAVRMPGKGMYLPNSFIERGLTVDITSRSTLRIICAKHARSVSLETLIIRP